MQIPFIATKLQIPTINHEFVSRPHLTARLDNGLKTRLTLICAPAGFGKTTLAGTWLTAQKMDKAWVSLSEDDNDPVRFVFYLVMAMQKSLEGNGSNTLKLLEKEKEPSPEAVLTHLINDMAVAGRDYVLVLDDFQMITEPNVYESLTFLLDHQPSNLRIVISSRSEPDLPLSRLRARRHLTEIDADDLRFSDDETRAFLNQVMALNLNDEEIALLGERTEGWIAGLQLAALAASGSSDSSQLIDKLSGTNRFIADYLVDEVLSRLPEHIQHFLLQTAIFDRFCAEMCDDILEINESRSIIETLESANMFIICLDTSRTWYRYHHLFAQMLLSRLERQDSAKISELYRKAYRWFKKEDRVAEALECSVKGGHYDQVEEIVEEVLEGAINNIPKRDILLDKEVDKISIWLSLLPDFMKTSLKVRLVEAFFLVRAGKFRQSEKLLKKVLASPPRPHPERYIIFSALGMSVIAYSRHLDGKESLQYCENAFQLLEKSNNCILAPFQFSKSHLLLGDTTRAEHYLNDATALETRQQQSFYLLPFCWGQLHEAKGQLHMALSQYQKDYDQNAKDIKSMGIAYSCQTTWQVGIYYEYNQLETCRDLLIQMQDAVEGIEYFDLSLKFHDILIRIYCASDSFEKAEKVLERVIRIVSVLDAPANVMRRIEVLRANLALKEGDLDRAARCARAICTSVKDMVRYDVEPELITLVRIHIAKKEFAPAMDLLERMLESAKEQNRVNSIIKLETLAARACFLNGDENQAMARLKQALIAAQPGGYIRTFIDEGESIQALLQMVVEQDDRRTWPEHLSGYIQMLLHHFGSPEQSASPGIKPSPNNRDIDDLTRREQQVLKLIAQGLAYEEVAASLAVSVNTVKFHIKNMYSKLHVNSRFKAVKRAEKIGLL